MIQRTKTYKKQDRRKYSYEHTGTGSENSSIWWTFDDLPGRVAYIHKLEPGCREISNRLGLRAGNILFLRFDRHETLCVGLSSQRGFQLYGYTITLAETRFNQESGQTSIERGKRIGAR